MQIFTVWTLPVEMIYPKSNVKKEAKPESFYIEKLEKLIENAIRLRLRSDVPYGMYFSGGLDAYSYHHI